MDLKKTTETDVTTMSAYLMSPNSVHDQAEENNRETSRDEYVAAAQQYLRFDYGTQKEYEQRSSESSPPNEEAFRTENEACYSGAAALLSNQELLRKDGKPRKRAPRQFKVEYSDPTEYREYQKMMDKERHKKWRLKKKQEKQMNDCSLFPPSNF
ncbi:hypothetical protein FHG87_004362 [Trinorchestia longiramus]|nr:hypothetical protein FHG87_004362 [Trinorchestia longiramus]